MSQSPKVTYLNLTHMCSKALASPDGYERVVYTVNNMFPGPVIEANTGDTIIVHVNNHLDEGQGIRKYQLIICQYPKMLF